MVSWDAVRDWMYTATIGFFVVTYWRATWTLMDVLGCDQASDASLARGDTFCNSVEANIDPTGDLAEQRSQTALVSFVVGYVLLAIGMGAIALGWWTPHLSNKNKNTSPRQGANKPLYISPQRGVLRWIIIYILGMSVVAIWRGIWYWTDAWILPTTPLFSYWTTSLVGAFGALCLNSVNSLLAAPAIFVLDGPDTDPPPIAVSLLSSYYSVALPADQPPPKTSPLVNTLDMIASFVLLPWATVWYWRGSWLVLDYYLWGLTASTSDVRMSILWGLFVALGFLVATSEPVVGQVDQVAQRLRGDDHETLPAANSWVWLVLGRGRSYVMAWGVVSFWRSVWYIWDESRGWFGGGTTLESALFSHVLSLVCLTLFGCVSSISAPPATMGVDTPPDPKCADEPLFSMIPVPWDVCIPLGLFRQVHPGKVVDTSAFLDPLDLSSSRHDSSVGKHSIIQIEGNPSRQGGEVELAPIDEDDMAPHDLQRHRHSDIVIGSRPMARPSLVRSDSAARWSLPELGNIYYSASLRYFRPGHRVEICTEYAQRPSMENSRSRSRLFRNR